MNSQSGDIFVEESEIEKGFAAYYERILRPYEVELENYRLKQLRQIFLCLIISLLLLAITAILLSDIFYQFAVLGSFVVLSRYSWADVVGAVLIVVAFFMLYRAHLLYRGFRGTIKQELFARIFGFFDEFSYYATGNGIADSYNKFLILPHHDMAHNEDLVFGEYKDVKFAFEELRLDKIHYNEKGEARRVKVFKGFAVILSMNKNFTGQTIIRRDLGKVAEWMRAKITALEKVSLEGVEFEKLFEVYSSNQIEARYLITTSFMERCIELAKALKLKSFEASFCENSLLLLFETTDDFFEPSSIFRKTNIINESKKVLVQMQRLFEIIDVLKLNQTTRI